MAEEQKKRTMEALERRFAQAKAEIHHQQNHKHQKISVTTTGNNTKSSSPSQLKSTAPSSSKKGIHETNPGLSSCNIDVELNNPAYLQISHSVDNNLLKMTTESSGNNTTVNDILHDLLQHGDSAQKYMQGSKNVKVDNWILLDNVVQKSSIATGARSRPLQRQSKRSKRRMSIKQHKKFGSFDLPQEFHEFNSQQRQTPDDFFSSVLALVNRVTWYLLVVRSDSYDIFKPMHDKWKDYVTKLLKNIGLAFCFLAFLMLSFFFKKRLFSCDSNKQLTFVQCKIAGLIGVRGIMIRETVETFGIITEENKFKVVPKKLSVFMLQVDCWKVTLLGDKLSSRNMTT
ncbi:putative interactor of constitutive active ROPs 2, chloroplastic-like isoform 1 [Capsicum annuum]|nr:putative interactor of constitutive active ROPs 2, chloroplastic-like isoform 1 [Capsicum annuum]